MHEVAALAQKMFDSALGTHDIRTIMNEGRLLQAFSHMINRGNRFGLIIRLDSSEILRAAQTYISLIESLGRREQVVPRLLSETVARVSREHADIIHQTDQSPSLSQAIDVVNRWLERIAARDPALLRELLHKIDLRAALAASNPNQGGEQHA